MTAIALAKSAKTFLEGWFADYYPDDCNVLRYLRSPNIAHTSLQR